MPQPVSRNIKPYSLSVLIFSFVLLVLSLACEKKSTTPTSTTPGANEVFMLNTAFTPATLTVPVNTTVKWTNKDGFAHTVTSDAGLFDSGTIIGGGTFTRQFTITGTYHYHCSIHSVMTATIIVQ